MAQFLCQLGDTKPDAWVAVEADDPKHAAAKMLNEHFKELPQDVYVSLGPERHPNGAPKAVGKMRVMWAE